LFLLSESQTLVVPVAVLGVVGIVSTECFYGRTARRESKPYDGAAIMKSNNPKIEIADEQHQ